MWKLKFWVILPGLLVVLAAGVTWASPFEAGLTSELFADTAYEDGSASGGQTGWDQQQAAPDTKTRKEKVPQNKTSQTLTYQAAPTTNYNYRSNWRSTRPRGPTFDANRKHLGKY